MPDATLRHLADETQVASRSEWGTAFRVQFPTGRDGGGEGQGGGGQGEEGCGDGRRVARERAHKDGHLLSLSVQDLLALARPPSVPPMGKGWASPLSWFSQVMNRLISRLVSR